METSSRRYGWSGFTNTKEWLSSMPNTFGLLARRSGYVRDGASQDADKAAAGAEMSKVCAYLWLDIHSAGHGSPTGCWPHAARDWMSH